MANAKQCDVCKAFYAPFEAVQNTYIDVEGQAKPACIKLPITPIMWNDSVDLCKSCLHTIMAKIVGQMERDLK